MLQKTLFLNLYAVQSQIDDTWTFLPINETKYRAESGDGGECTYAIAKLVLH
jgi:hypothetical protein